MGDTWPWKRSQPDEPLVPYLLWGYISGPKLPMLFETRHVRIAEEQGSRLDYFSKSRAGIPALSLPDVPGYATGQPADIIVRSKHFVFVRVDSLSPQQAYVDAVSKHLPPVLFAVSTIAGSTVHVELVRVAVEAEDGSLSASHSPFDPSTMIVGQLNASMGQDELGVVSERWRRVANDPLALAAASALVEADRLAATTGGVSSIVQQVLLQYFFVVEQISRKVGYDKKFDQGVANLQSKVVGSLRQNLEGKDSTRKKVNQVRNTAKALDALDRRYLSDQIRKTGERLGLSKELVDEGLAFADLRNRRLGHPQRSDVMAEDLFGWVARARVVATGFLTSYAG
jgi:hypothetical protein